MIKFTNIPTFPKIAGKFVKLIEAERTTNGYLYNFYAIDNPNFAPNDWGLPTSAEYYDIINGFTVQDMKTEIAGFWTTEDGNNSSGFAAVGSGIRNYYDYFYIKEYGNYRTSDAFALSIGNMPYDISVTTIDNEVGASVRLVYRGSGTPDNTITDIDGNKYDVVNINGYYVTKHNWKCSRLSNGQIIPLIVDHNEWINLSTMGKCAYNNDESNV